MTPDLTAGRRARLFDLQKQEHLHEVQARRRVKTPERAPVADDLVALRETACKSLTYRQPPSEDA